MKPANITAVLQFAAGVPSPVQGTKLKALYTLIQKAGEPVTTTDEKSPLNGLKALRLDANTFIVLSRRAVGPDFFPCSMHMYLLEEL